MSEKERSKAEKRLLKQGVRFVDEEFEREDAGGPHDFDEAKYLCYYVVTLTWYARAAKYSKYLRRSWVMLLVRVELVYGRT